MDKIFKFFSIISNTKKQTQIHLTIYLCENVTQKDYKKVTQKGYGILSTSSEES